MADTTPKPKPKRQNKKSKPKLTKEERRAKYTAIARDRRDKRLKRNHDKDIICYRCRKKGHSAESCTADGSAAASNTANNKKKGGMICYKCGSTEHRIQQCCKIKPYLQKNNSGDDANGGKNIDFSKLGDLPYANCYICNESGHLSGFCPKNTKGVFPEGGKCRECGEGGHFAKDCPTKNGGKKKQEDVQESDESVTIEQYLEDEDDKVHVEGPSKRKKKKVVNF